MFILTILLIVTLTPSSAIPIVPTSQPAAIATFVDTSAFLGVPSLSPAPSPPNPVDDLGEGEEGESANIAVNTTLDPTADTADSIGEGDGEDEDVEGDVDVYVDQPWGDEEGEPVTVNITGEYEDIEGDVDVYVDEPWGDEEGEPVTVNITGEYEDIEGDVDVDVDEPWGDEEGEPVTVNITGEYEDIEGDVDVDVDEPWGDEEGEPVTVNITSEYEDVEGGVDVDVDEPWGDEEGEPVTVNITGGYEDEEGGVDVDVVEPWGGEEEPVTVNITLAPTPIDLRGQGDYEDEEQEESEGIREDYSYDYEDDRFNDEYDVGIGRSILPTYTPTPEPTVRYISKTGIDPLAEEIEPDLADFNDDGAFYHGLGDKLGKVGLYLDGVESPQKLEKDKNVQVIAGVLVVVSLGLLLVTAHLVMQYPDGLCAGFCRLTLKCICCFTRMICLPCRAICCKTSDQTTRRTHAPMRTPFPTDLELA